MEQLLICMSLSLIAGLLASRAAKAIRLPAVTSYLVAGLLLGPFFLGRLGLSGWGFGFGSLAQVEGYGIITQVALGFIAFVIGNEFRLSALESMGRQAVTVGILQAVITTVLVDIALVALHFARPDVISMASAITLGAIASATAPAATLMVVKQYKASGPLTRLLLMVVAIDDAVGLVLFSASFGIANALEQGRIDPISILLEPLVEIVLSLGLGALAGLLLNQLEVYFLENPDEAVKIGTQVLINKRSRENADKVRQSTLQKLTGTIDLTNRIDKFVDCRSKDVSRREVYIVEGDSALGSVKLARDAEFQAVIPVRGKILNCLKASYDKIFKSEIITNLIKVLGCGVEVKTKANRQLSTFNLDNLRWNKIVICTDADEDGFQIRTLILTMIQELCPTLIEKGYVYIAESPLYEITTKERTYFAYTEPEKTKILGMIGDAKYTIQRSKGLGENDPDMMSLTTMNPETRRLIKVNPTDVEATREMFDVLLGNDLEGRKRFIRENGSRYLAAADIS